MRAAAGATSSRSAGSRRSHSGRRPSSARRSTVATYAASSRPTTIGPPASRKACRCSRRPRRARLANDRAPRPSAGRNPTHFPAFCGIFPRAALPHEWRGEKHARETRLRFRREGEMSTIDMWTYRTTQTGANIDLRGFTVEAIDGSIGKIDEATYDVGGSYVVVDTGPWIFGKKVLLPAGVLRDVGFAPIVEGKRLIGTLTDRDVAIGVVAEGKDPRSTSVRAVASKQVVTIDPQQSLDEALRLMAKHQVRRLPVVEEDGRLIGVVAQADIAREAGVAATGGLVEDISR